MSNYCLSLLASLPVLLLPWVLRVLFQSWIAPPAFCALYWAGFVTINLGFPEYPLLSGGLFYIFGALTIFAIGHYLATNVLVRRRSTWPELRKPRKISGLLFRTGLALHLAIGFSYVAVLQKMGVQQVENIDWLTQLLLISHFLGPILVGLILGGGLLQKWDAALAPLVLAPALAISILYTGRTAFIGPAVLTITGFLAGTVTLRPYRTPLFSFRRVVLVAGAFAFAVVYGTVIYSLRVARGEGSSLATLDRKDLSGSFEDSRWSESYQTIRTSVFGQPSAFTFMLRDHFSSPEFVPYYGRFMFAGPFVLLGHDRPPHVSYVSPDGVDTNVYTIFAPPLEDFGVGGSFLWWGFLGTVSAFGWRLAQNGHLTGAAILVILLINFQIGSCFLFRYNSVIGAYFLAILGCVWLDQRQSKRPATDGTPQPVSPSLPADIHPASTSRHA